MSPALLEYERSGGVAALRDRLVVEQDARASVTRKGRPREIELDAALLRRIVDGLDKGRFLDLRADYTAEGADLMTYSIVYRGHTVRAMDTAVPWSLQPVLHILNDILDR